MVDLIMLALLVTSDLPLGLFTQVADSPDLCALPHRVLHRLGERQAGLSHPLIQASVDCRGGKQGRCDCSSVHCIHMENQKCTHIPHSGHKTPLCPPAHSVGTESLLLYL